MGPHYTWSETQLDNDLSKVAQYGKYWLGLAPRIHHREDSWSPMLAPGDV